MSDETQTPAPPVYALLAGEPNLAVDTALLEALPELEPELQPVALDTLVARARSRGLTGVVGNFLSYERGVQDLIVARVSGLYAGIRLAITDGRAEYQAGAIELIRRSGHCKLAYLLTDALRSTAAERQTRDEAAAVLLRMTADYLSRCRNGTTNDAEARELAQDGEYLARALRHAIECWEHHFRGDVLVAAIWLAHRLAGVLLHKADAPRTQFARALIETAYGGYDPQDGRLAAFAFLALPSPQLRAEMTKRLSACRRPDFIRGLIDESWLLSAPQIKAAFQRVRQLAWLQEIDSTLLDLPQQQAEGMLRLIGASGLTPDAKVAAYGELLSAGGPAVQKAAFWSLTEINTVPAVDLLQTLSRRRDGRLATLAARELRRRGCTLDEPSPADEQSPEPDALEPGSGFDEMWRIFDHLDQTAQRDAGAVLAGRCDEFMAPLEQKLKSPDARGRCTGLRIARVLGLAQPLADRVYKLANDPDPTVRSAAAALLGDLGGATSRLILRRLLEDPDPRVQANAVEAIDVLDEPGRDERFLPKLASRHHRVRATAVASLLKLRVEQAGDVLLQMLEDPSRAQRISALWVVERLQLGSMMQRLEDLLENDPDPQVRRRAGRVHRSIANWPPPTEPVAAQQGDML